MTILRNLNNEIIKEILQKIKIYFLWCLLTLIQVFKFWKCQCLLSFCCCQVRVPSAYNSLYCSTFWNIFVAMVSLVLKMRGMTLTLGMMSELQMFFLLTSQNAVESILLYFCCAYIGVCQRQLGSYRWWWYSPKRKVLLFNFYIHRYLFQGIKSMNISYIIIVVKCLKYFSLLYSENFIFLKMILNYISFWILVWSCFF